jgi:hypothetical protein
MGNDLCPAIRNNQLNNLAKEGSYSGGCQIYGGIPRSGSAPIGTEKDDVAF